MGDDKNSIQEFSYEPNFTRTPPQASLAKVHAPHWSATRPRSKTQPTTNTIKLLATKNQSGWFLKPVRPLLWDLASQQAGFGKTVRPVLSRKSPRHLRDSKQPQNTSRTFPPLNKKSHSMTETLLLKNPS
jgi:hypothetical protein